MKFYTLTETALLEQDAKFWATSLDTYIELYRRTKVDSAEDRHNKAMTCAKLAGLAMAMAAHFGHGVAALNDIESPLMTSVGAETFERFSAHTDRLEEASKRRLS